MTNNKQTLGKLWMLEILDTDLKISMINMFKKSDGNGYYREPNSFNSQIEILELQSKSIMFGRRLHSSK